MEIDQALNIESMWRVSALEVIYKTIAIRRSHSATLDENQEDKLDW